jgi:branched-chain amino acid transport system ATP-binding protein
VPNVLLVAENLYKKFGGAMVLNDVRLEVDEGEIVAIIGPNGAGKTVLFSLITGIHDPTFGRIYLKGDDITGLRPHLISQKGIARTFQLTTLFDQLRVIDNLCIGYQQRTTGGLWSTIFHSRRWRKDVERVTAKVTDILKFIGLEKRANDIVSTISHGEQRKLSIGVALAGEPKLILLDEPTGGLIHEDTDEITHLIRKMNESGITVCLIEHKMRMVMDLAQRIVVLNHGSLIAEGTPKEIGRNQKVIEAYLGRKRHA